MKTRTFVTTLLAMAVAASTLAQVSAKSKDDEKKAATATPRVPDEYRMNAGDKLRIEVYKDAQLSQSAQVRPDGKVTLPLIGDLMASGLTPIELRDQIATKLKEYVTNPTVTVIVVETDPMVGVPGYESWWDVAVAEVSESESVRQARTRYVEARKKERYHL